jgi:hypothetical protein
MVKTLKRIEIMFSLKYWPHFLCLAALSLLYAEPISDRLVAIVEKKPITELELIERYHIHQKTHSAYPSDYQTVRSELIQELCLEKMNDLLWERLTNNSVDLSDEQLQAFKKNYHLEEFKNSTIQSFYAGLLKKERLARHLIQDNIQLSDYELEHFMHQPQAWSQLGALWSFKMVYSSEPLDETTAEEQSRLFNGYPAAKINKAIHENIKWSQLGSWQFFKQDDEYVGIYIEAISLPHMLDCSYKVNLLHIDSNVEPSNDTILSLFNRKDNPNQDVAINQLTIQSSTDLPSIMIEDLIRLTPEEVTKPVMIGGRWYVAQLVSKEPHNIDQLKERLTALFKQQLLDKKTEEKLPLWYDALKKDYFIKVLN